MKKIISSLSSLGTILVYLFLIWGEFGGLYHTYTKHRKDLVATIFLPPVSWYRSIEFFWHNDYSGKKWEKTKLADAHLIGYLINASFKEDKNQVVLNEEIESFSERISKYPKSSKEYLITIFNDYVNYQLGIQDESMEMLKGYLKTGTITRFMSEKTKGYHAKLIEYGLKDILDVAEKELNKAISFLENDKDGTIRRKFELGFDEFEKYEAEQKEMMKVETDNLFKKIFD